MDELADSVQFELGAKIGNDRDKRPDRAKREQEDRAQRDAADDQRHSVGVGGHQFGGTDERPVVMQEPTTDRGVPTLDRPPTAAAHDQVADDETEREDPDCGGRKQPNGARGTPPSGSRVSVLASLISAAPV